MCETCVHTAPKLTSYRENRYDPTRTLTLRNNFVSALNVRFAKLRGDIRRAIVVQDVFGLRVQTNQAPGTRAFNFPRSGDKVSSFMEWLQQQVDKGILETGTMPQLGRAAETPWTNLYIQDSYKRGVIRSRYEMGRAGMAVPRLDETGGIGASMSTPFHMDRVGLIYTRVYNELKGVTDAMDHQISRVLAQGIADGDGPALLARKINSVISGSGAGELGIHDTLGRFIPAQRRAKILARTEVIRAHHQAMVQEYRNWGVEGVRVQAEWRTAGDDRVCELCASLEGRVYSLDEIENLIPRHPQCRCLALPTMPGQVPVSSQPTEQELKDELETAFQVDDRRRLDLIDFRTGHDISVMKETNDTLLRLNKTYENKLSFVLAYTRSNKAYAAANGNTMFMNPTYFKSRKTLVDSLRRDVTSGFHPRGTASVKALIEHEWAHVLTLDAINLKGEFYKKAIAVKSRYARKMNDIRKKALEKVTAVEKELRRVANEMTQVQQRMMRPVSPGEQQRLLAENTKLSKQWNSIRVNLDGAQEHYRTVLLNHSDYISVYANKNVHEFVAESFAFVLNDPNPSPFAREIFDLINQFYGRP